MKLKRDMSAVAEYTAGYLLVNFLCSSSHKANPTTFASMEMEPSSHRTVPCSPPACLWPLLEAGLMDDVVWVSAEPL